MKGRLLTAEQLGFPSLHLPGAATSTTISTDEHGIPTQIPFPLPDDFIEKYGKMFEQKWEAPKYDNEVAATDFKKELNNVSGTTRVTDGASTMMGAIGGTPMISLNKFAKLLGLDSELLVKYEGSNIGGSIKDRAAFAMFDYEKKKGTLKDGDFIVESTSGNTGIALAMAARSHNLRAILTMPDKMSKSKADVMRALGAQVIRTDSSVPYDNPKAHIGVAKTITNIINGIADHLEKTQPAGAKIHRAVYMNQYSHPANPCAHYSQTAEEILQQLGDKGAEAIVMTVGTGGTLSGVGCKFKEKLPQCRIVGVEPEGSIIADVDRSKLKKWLVEGIGKDFRPPNVDLSMTDEWLQVSDASSMTCARLVMQTEGLMVGGSGGCAIAAAVGLCRELGPSSRVVAIVPDSIRNYLNTFISDEWLVLQGIIGPIAYLPQHQAAIASLDDRTGVKFSNRNVENLMPESATVASVDMCENLSVGNVLRETKLNKPDVIVLRGSENRILGAVTSNALGSLLISGDVQLQSPILKAVKPLSWACVNRSYSVAEISTLMHVLERGNGVPDPVILCMDQTDGDGSSHYEERIAKHKEQTARLVDTDVIAAFTFKSLFTYISDYSEE